MCDKNRARVECARGTAVAAPFRARLHQFSQISRDRVNPASANLPANRFIIGDNLIVNMKNDI